VHIDLKPLEEPLSSPASAVTHGRDIAATHWLADGVFSRENIAVALQPLALGVPALIQSLETLSETGGHPFTVRPGAVRLEPGSIWTGDAMVLSATPGSVHFTRGDALYRQETVEFVARSYAPATRPAWMPILFSAQRGLPLKIAAALCYWWGPRGSVCAWLNTYGTFYCSHRSQFEAAALHTRLLADTLFGLETRWPGLFNTLIRSMGEAAPFVLKKWVRAPETAPFLGVLLGSQGDDLVSLDGLSNALAAMRETPTEEYEACMAAPVYGMMIRRAEEAVRELAPIVERLRAELYPQAPAEPGPETAG
jgi:hypothetical protein